MRSIILSWLLITLFIIPFIICSSSKIFEKKSSSSLSLIAPSTVSTRSTSLSEIPVVLDEDSDSNESESSVASSIIFKRLGPHSPLRQKTYSTNTLLIDREFNEEWKNILAGLESLLPVRSGSSFLSFTSQEEAKKAAQKKLISAIKKDNGKEVRIAISSGASFLSIDLDTRIKTSNYYPVEYAVLINHLRALNMMLAYMSTVESCLLSTFYGGLMIRAVQAGQFDALKLLFTKYKAPYLKGSFLFQQAIMHKAPATILEFITQNFPTEPEIYDSFGRHRNFPLHLAVVYNNPVAFNFIFHSTAFGKNQINADSLRPINLVLTLQRSNFLTDLFTQYPQLRTIWTDELGNNLLHLSVLQGSLALVQYFVETVKIPIDVPNRHGVTPLNLAASLRFRDIVIYLIGKGAFVLEMDKKNNSPLLIMARLSDYEAFGFALESLQSMTISIPPLQSFVQVLINENLYNYVEIMFRKFPILKIIPYHFFVEHVNQLMLSGALWDLPNLLEIFIKIRYINPNLFIHQAAALGKIEALKVLISNGAHLDLLLQGSADKPIDFAIKHKQAEVTRFLLTFGGWVVQNYCLLDNFVFVLTNGASFHPNNPSKITYYLKSVILKLFFDYFQQIQESRRFDPYELTAMLLQLEIFIFYHMRTTKITQELTINLRILQDVKENIASMIGLNPQIREQFPILIPLLSLYSINNSLFLQKCLHILLQHRVVPNRLAGYISPANQYLLVEYESII